MSDQKKLVLMELDDKTYEMLQKNALESSRMLGNEVALRLTHALNHFESFSEALIQKHKNCETKTNRIIQVQLPLDIHTKLKTVASSTNFFVKEFSVLLLMQSLEDFEFVVSSEKGIPTSNKSIDNKKSK